MIYRTQMTIFVEILEIHFMEKFARQFFSMRMMAVGMFIFFIAIGAATFVESIYDIQTAKRVIYNAKWFEILLGYLGINLIANIFTYRLAQRKQWASLIFHLSFIIILLGAGVTRFLSFEGVMRVAEGGQSNFIYSADPYLWYKINDGKKQLTNDHKLFLTGADYWDDFSFPVNFPGRDEISIDFVSYDKKMVDSLVINDSIKETALEFVRAGRSEYLSENNFLMWDGLAVSFEKEDAMPGLEFFKKGRKILMRSMTEVTALPMSVLRASDRTNPNIPDSLYKKVPMDTLVPLEMATLYAVGNVQFVFKDIHKNAKMMKLPSGKKNEGLDQLKVRITDGKKTKLVELPGGMQSIPEHVVFNFNGLTYEMEYGSKRIMLPFAIACRDFELERYPGSNSPSSFASEVSIIDTEKNFPERSTYFYEPLYGL